MKSVICKNSNPEIQKQFKECTKLIASFMKKKRLKEMKKAAAIVAEQKGVPVKFAYRKIKKMFKNSENKRELDALKTDPSKT